MQMHFDLYQTFQVIVICKLIIVICKLIDYTIDTVLLIINIIVDMSIQSHYAGKRILITGTTGFLGKVLLEKFLFSLSSVEKIYVLIRNKEGSNLYERFKKQVVSSLCFDRIRNIYKHKFADFIKDKIQPIEGDLLKEGLGLTKQSQSQLIENCHMIINCAASIDFNARLDYAINININGPLRIIQLARKMKKLECLTHISTCYVNCDLKGLIKEQIYERQQQAEGQYKTLTEYTNEQLISNTKKILGLFPNTYTYTKSLCERLVAKRKEDLPICIVRPAIISTSYYQPFPGWIDSLAALTALYLFVGLGIIKQIKGRDNNILDTIPVDTVVATIIAASAYNINNKNLTLYHVGTSDRNPLTVKQIKQITSPYWNTNKIESQISKSEITLTTNDSYLRYLKFKRTLPLEIYKRLSPLLGIQHVKKTQKMIKTLKTAQEIGNMFEFFAIYQWIYECRNFKKIWDILSAEDRLQFRIDPAEIDANKFIWINNYGIQKYILKQNVQKLQSSNLLRIHTKNEYFGDFKWILNNEIITNKKKVINQLKTKLLLSSSVLKAIQAQTNKLIKKNNVSQSIANSKVKSQAQKIINDLIGEVKPTVFRSMGWALHKLFKNLYDKIIINMQMLQNIREIENNSDLPIILLPTHRSYFDFLIVSYIFFVYKLRLPFYVQDQAFLQSYILSFVAKSCGGFFFQKEKYSQSLLYRIIFDKYIEILLRQGNTLEFFIEGRRSRTGKILAPQFEILNIVFDSIIYEKVPQVCIIPLTINYEKVFEGDTFPNELLGEEKVAESLIQVIKATPNMLHNYGRVYVQICKPIMVRSFISDLKLKGQNNKIESSQGRQNLLKYFGRSIMKSLTKGIVIMSTAMVSSVLLMNHKGISQDSLIKLVNQLAKYIVNKGYKIGGINENSSAVAVRNSIVHLNGIITKTKKDIFQLTISAGNQFQKILMLSYYRNTLIHAFMPQGLIGYAMASFGQQLSLKQGILCSRVFEKVIFLIQLFQQQYFIEYADFNMSNFNKLIEKLNQSSIIEIQQQKVIICTTGINMIAFFCSLIKPQIQCYWASLVYIITIARSPEKNHETSSLAKFYDTVQWFMQSLYNQKVIQDYQACSLELIKNAFQKYQKEKIISIKNRANKKEGSSVSVLVDVSILQGLQNKIKFFRKSLQNSIMSPMELAKSSMKDIIGMSKI